MLKLGKVCFSILIIYILWFKEAFGNYPVILYGTFVAGVACTITGLIYHRKIEISGIPGMYIAFGVYSLISGLLVAKNSAWFTSSMMTYFAFAIACFCIHYILRVTDSFSWILGCIKISATLCAIYTLIAGVDYQTEVIVRTMSAENNPHTLGFVMILGIYAVVSDKEKMKRRFWINLVFIMLYLLIILICGSRKSLIAAGILVILWMINMLKTEHGLTYKKISNYAGILVVVIVGAYYVVNYYMTSASFERLLLLKNSDGAAHTRWELYLDAFEFWKTSPIIGIGFGQFQILSRSGVYTHSSYAEILSCTGIVGFLIFFIPLIRMTKRMIKETRIQKRENNQYEITICLAMMLVEWLLGVGQIYIYDFSHMLILTYLYARFKTIQSERMEQSIA